MIGGATVTALQTFPEETATHLVLSALWALPASAPVTEDALRSAMQNIVGQDVDFASEEFNNAIGEMYVACLFFIDSCATINTSRRITCAIN